MPHLLRPLTSLDRVGLGRTTLRSWANPATFFTVAVLVHNSDHLRRGADSVGRDVFWLGSLAIIIEVAVVVA